MPELTLLEKLLQSPVTRANWRIGTKEVSAVGSSSVLGTATTVSMPAGANSSSLSASFPVPIDCWPSSVPDRKNVSPCLNRGPPKLPVTRLNPRLLLPVTASFSYPRVPLYLVPPARVAIETTPAWALPNSDEVAPVVTCACSKASALTSTWVPEPRSTLPNTVLWPVPR